MRWRRRQRSSALHADQRRLHPRRGSDAAGDADLLRRGREPKLQVRRVRAAQDRCRRHVRQVAGLRQGDAAAARRGPRTCPPTALSHANGADRCPGRRERRARRRSTTGSVCRRVCACGHSGRDLCPRSTGPAWNRYAKASILRPQSSSSDRYCRWCPSSSHALAIRCNAFAAAATGALRSRDGAGVEPLATTSPGDQATDSTQVSLAHSQSHTSSTTRRSRQPLWSLNGSPGETVRPGAGEVFAPHGEHPAGGGEGCSAVQTPSRNDFETFDMRR